MRLSHVWVLCRKTKGSMWKHQVMVCVMSGQMPPRERWLCVMFLIIYHVIAIKVWELLFVYICMQYSFVLYVSINLSNPTGPKNNMFIGECIFILCMKKHVCCLSANVKHTLVCCQDFDLFLIKMATESIDELVDQMHLMALDGSRWL